MVRESDFNMNRTTRPVSRPVRRPAATGPADSSCEWRNNSLPSCVRAREIAESVATAAVADQSAPHEPTGHRAPANEGSSRSTGYWEMDREHAALPGHTPQCQPTAHAMHHALRQS